MRQKLTEYALRLISKKRYTVEEMRKKLEALASKLLSKRDESEEPLEPPIELVIERLRELDYLNDQSYLQNYIADRIRFRPRGEFMIRQELRKKGIDKKLLDDYLMTEKVDELGAAKKLLESKKRRWMNENIQKQKEKAYRFLASKGFKPDNIYKAVDCCYNHSQEVGSE